MSANPNNFNYWLRGGTVLPPYVRASAQNTNNAQYFDRAGTVVFSAMIQIPVTGNTAGILPVLGLY